MRRVMIGVGVGAAVVAIGGALALGPIDPPGTPESTYRTLDEVEPRRMITQADLPLIIRSSGSYYLTENLTANTAGVPMIDVRVANVTIDLNGFTMSGSGLFGSATEGVRHAGGDNLQVENGTIRDCGGNGIGFEVGNDGNIVVQNMRILSNGDHGIELPGSQVRVEDCTVVGNIERGVSASVLHIEGCFVQGNGDVGVVALSGMARSNTVVGHSSLNIGILTGLTADNYAP